MIGKFARALPSIRTGGEKAYKSHVICLTGGRLYGLIET
jgi:hypothetical protein